MCRVYVCRVYVLIRLVYISVYKIYNADVDVCILDTISLYIYTL